MNDYIDDIKFGLRFSAMITYWLICCFSFIISIFLIWKVSGYGLILTGISIFLLTLLGKLSRKLDI